MLEKDFQNEIDKIKTAVGDEIVGKIADTLGILISDNSNMNSELNKKDDTIKNLQADKDRLIQTNGNLLLQVTAGKEEDIINTNEKKEKEEEKKYIDFRTAFDEKRKF